MLWKTQYFIKSKALWCFESYLAVSREKMIFWNKFPSGFVSVQKPCQTAKINEVKQTSLDEKPKTYYHPNHLGIRYVVESFSSWLSLLMLWAYLSSPLFMLEDLSSNGASIIESRLFIKIKILLYIPVKSIYVPTGDIYLFKYIKILFVISCYALALNPHKHGKDCSS